MISSSTVKTAVLSLIVVLVLVLSGCSRDNGKPIRYEAEKLLLKAEKLFKTASIKPDLKNLDQWNQIKSAYSDAAMYCWTHLDSLPIEKYPKERIELENIAFMAANRLSTVYFTERKIDSAILVLNQLLTFTHLEGNPLLTSQMNLAQLYLAKGNWQQTLQIYRVVMDHFYPPVGDSNKIIVQVLNLPLQIIQMVQLERDMAALTEEKKSAKDYYNKLIKEWPNSPLETAARSNLARLYTDDGDWDNAIATLRLLKDSTGTTDIEAEMMIANITASAKKQYPRAIAMYDSLIGKTSDTTIVPLIYVRKGITYFSAGDYEKCRVTMSEIKKQYPHFYQKDPVPQDYLARSFEKEGNWFQAESELQWLMQNYPTTEQAFDAYLTIADHYFNAGDSTLGNSWYKKGVDFYDKMSRQYSGSSVEASAISYKAEVARRQQKWDEAAQYLREIYDKFPGSDIGRNSILTAAAVYREKLNNPAEADSILSRVKRELLPADYGKNIEPVTDDKK